MLKKINFCRLNFCSMHRLSAEPFEKLSAVLVLDDSLLSEVNKLEKEEKESQIGSKNSLFISPSYENELVNFPDFSHNFFCTCETKIPNAMKHLFFISTLILLPIIHSGKKLFLCQKIPSN